MDTPYSGFFISMHGVTAPIATADKREWAYYESLIREDFDRSHPDDTLECLKQRARFSKEDRGLLRDWMEAAVQRAVAQREIRFAVQKRKNSKFRRVHRSVKW